MRVIYATEDSVEDIVLYWPGVLVYQTPFVNVEVNDEIKKCRSTFWVVGWLNADL